MKLITIIPARGGSKGVKRKNLRTVGGVSLVGRAIKCAQQVNAFDNIFVSTEDEAIKNEALDHGAEVPYLRSQELASDYASMQDTLKDALNNYKVYLQDNIFIVVLMEPTNPFRKPESIAKALDLYSSGSFSSVIGVCSLERKPENIFKKNYDILEQYIKDPDTSFVRRQDMEHLCRLSSVVYIFDSINFETNMNFMQHPMGYVENTSIEAINIDTQLDLDFANFIAEKYNL